MSKQSIASKQAETLTELCAAFSKLEYKVFEETLRIYGNLFSELNVSHGGDVNRRHFFASKKIHAEIIGRVTSLVPYAERKTKLGQFYCRIIRSTARNAVLLPRLGVHSQKSLRLMLKRFNQDLGLVVEQRLAFERTLRFVEDLQDAAVLPMHLKPRDLITKMLDHFTPEE